MVKKNEITYTKLFKYLKSLLNSNTLQIVCNFEQSHIYSLKMISRSSNIWMYLSLQSKDMEKDTGSMVLEKI